MRVAEKLDWKGLSEGYIIRTQRDGHFQNVTYFDDYRTFILDKDIS
jgi:hypothetical protein